MAGVGKRHSCGHWIRDHGFETRPRPLVFSPSPPIGEVTNLHHRSVDLISETASEGITAWKTSRALQGVTWRQNGNPGVGGRGGL